MKMSHRMLLGSGKALIWYGRAIRMIWDRKSMDGQVFHLTSWVALTGRVDHANNLNSWAVKFLQESMIY